MQLLETAYHALSMFKDFRVLLDCVHASVIPMVDNVVNGFLI